MISRTLRVKVGSSYKKSSNFVVLDGDSPLVDPECDPAHPKKVTFSDISSAAFNIKDGIIKTPCNVGMDC